MYIDTARIVPKILFSSVSMNNSPDASGNTDVDVKRVSDGLVEILQPLFAQMHSSNPDSTQPNDIVLKECYEKFQKIYLQYFWEQSLNQEVCNYLEAHLASQSEFFISLLKVLALQKDDERRKNIQLILSNQLIRFVFGTDVHTK